MSTQNKNNRSAIEADSGGRPTTPRPRPPKEKKGSAVISRQQIISKMLFDLTNFLQELPAFTFALLGADGTCATGPSLASTIDLVCGATEGWDYEGPYPPTQFRSACVVAERRLAEIVAAVQERVQQLRAADVSFILCWQAYGEKDAHVDWHGKYSEGDVREELFELLTHEIECYA